MKWKFFRDERRLAKARGVPEVAGLPVCPSASVKAALTGWLRRNSKRKIRPYRHHNMSALMIGFRGPSLPGFRRAVDQGASPGGAAAEHST